MIGRVALVMLALATTAYADKPATKGAANTAEMWLRYLGPAADTAKAHAMTADALYVAILDGEEGHDACNGTFDKAKIKDTLECLLAHHPWLYEYDFAIAKPKDLTKLPGGIAKDKAKIDTAAKSSLMMIHDYEESGRREIVIIALVKGKAGKAKVSAVWLAHQSTDSKD
jgi:hypothetical protein